MCISLYHSQTNFNIFNIYLKYIFEILQYDTDHVTHNLESTSIKIAGARDTNNNLAIETSKCSPHIPGTHNIEEITVTGYYISMRKLADHCSWHRYREEGTRIKNN